MLVTDIKAGHKFLPSHVNYIDGSFFTYFGGGGGGGEYTFENTLAVHISSNQGNPYFYL